MSDEDDSPVVKVTVATVYAEQQSQRTELTRIATILDERLPAKAISSVEFDDHEKRLRKLESSKNAQWGVLAFLAVAIPAGATIIGVFVH